MGQFGISIRNRHQSRGQTARGAQASSPRRCRRAAGGTEAGAGEDEGSTLRDFWLEIIPEASLRVPKQDNSYDRGVYMLRYLESILEMLRGPWAERLPASLRCWS